MSWFAPTPRPPLNAAALKAGATWIRGQTQPSTIYSVRVGLRAALLAAGYEADDVERVIAHLLE